MRYAPLSPALLLAPLLFCAAARADTIDNFTLVGNGLTITFTNPDILSAMDHPHLITFYGTNGKWYPPFGFFNLTAEVSGLTLGGVSVLRFVPPPPGAIPGYDYVQFQPGTYSLYDYWTFTPYTLTITRPGPTAPTPEPTSLLLLGTGALLAGLKMRGRAARCPRYF